MAAARGCLLGSQNIGAGLHENTYTAMLLMSQASV
jgi:hypothetical protein